MVCCYSFVLIFLMLSIGQSTAVPMNSSFHVKTKFSLSENVQCCCHETVAFCDLHLKDNLVITNKCFSYVTTLTLNEPAVGTIKKLHANFTRNMQHLIINGGRVDLAEFNVFINSSLMMLTLNQTTIDGQEHPLPAIETIKIYQTNLNRLPFFHPSFNPRKRSLGKYVGSLLLDNNQIKNTDVDIMSAGVYAHLERLSLRGNQISSLVNFEILNFMQGLKWLDLSNNSISTVDKMTLAPLIQLHYLSLKDQRITGPFQFQADLLDSLLTQINHRWQLRIELPQYVYCNCTTSWIQSWIFNSNPDYFVANYDQIACFNKVLPGNSQRAINRVDFSRCQCRQHDCHDPMSYCHYYTINGGFAADWQCGKGYATYFDGSDLRKRCYPSKTASCRHSGTELSCSGNGYDNVLRRENLGDAATIYRKVFDNNNVFLSTLHLFGFNFANQSDLIATMALIHSHYFTLSVSKIVIEDCILPQLDVFPFLNPLYSAPITELVIRNSHLQSITLPHPRLVPNLQKLYLEYNNLSAFPMPPAPYGNLTLLMLKNNAIQDIPSDFNNMYSRLSKVDLTYNSIQQIPTHLLDKWRRSRYTYVDLSYNNIKILPTSLAEVIVTRSARMYFADLLDYIVVPIRLRGNLIPFDALIAFTSKLLMDNGNCMPRTGQFSSNQSHVMFYQQHFFDTYLPCNCHFALQLKPLWIKCLNLTHRCSNQGIQPGQPLDSLLHHRCKCSKERDVCVPFGICHESSTELASSCVLDFRARRSSVSSQGTIGDLLCYNISVIVSPSTLPSIIAPPSKSLSTSTSFTSIVTSSSIDDIQLTQTETVKNDYDSSVTNISSSPSKTPSNHIIIPPDSKKPEPTPSIAITTMSSLNRSTNNSEFQTNPITPTLIANAFGGGDEKVAYGRFIV
ncbi:hypothetical protein TrispH2_005258 [Trichoplax sp. H2]|nr:hypothetical protein TrispH2_005258 [Trichoplax sp. H2]|eukprot:RDD42861.1 hypothetical protein TrispH2_005258 [Trichoplax sp. H2]